MAGEMTPARHKLQMARTALVLDQPFFGALALRLRVVEDPGCGTAWTDGQSLGYDPAFVVGLSQAELLFVVAHEVMHCAMGHPWRRDGRDPLRWNVACDYAINAVLNESGFTLWPHCLISPEFSGKSGEWIYPRLADPQGGGGNGGQEGPAGRVRGRTAGLGAPGRGKPGPGGPSAPGGGRAVPGAGAGDVRDAPMAGAGAEGDVGYSEADWQQAVQQAAAAAKGRGSLPAALARFAEQTAKPRVDWRSVLHRFVQAAAVREDYSWSLPNRRFLAGGLYLPALRGEAVGPIAVAIDTSGSVDQVLLAQFAAELRSVADDVRPSRIHVIWCDAAVQRVDTFERDEMLELRPVGGGGTVAKPALDYADALEEPPVCLVYLTDLDIHHRPEPPAMPILWVAPPEDVARHRVPYGEVVSIE